MIQTVMKELEKRLLAAVEEFIVGEESYDDNAQISIDPVSRTVELIAGDELPEDTDSSALDYYDVMDMVMMSPEEPGKWLPDNEAIASVAAEY